MMRTITFLAAFCLANGAHATTTELIVNGSFEANDIADNTAMAGASSPGWNTIPFLFDGAPAGIWPVSGNTGRQYADIGNNAGSFILQFLMVGVGDVIDSITWFDNTAESTGLSFYDVQLLDASGGVPTVLESQSFTAVANRLSWTQESFALSNTYGAGMYAIKMFGTTGIGTGDTLIDDVSVLAAPAPVPLPASLPLLLVALGGSFAFSRRNA